MKLEGKVAIVTGAGRGIGRGIALKLAAEGAAVVANSLSQPNIDALVSEITLTGGKCLGISADVSSSADVTRLFDAVLAAYGNIDILVNNAGITRDQLIIRMTDEDWDAVLDTDLKSVFPVHPRPP